jgi:trehalose 6-phosphate phosphatase
MNRRIRTAEPTVAHEPASFYIGTNVVAPIEAQEMSTAAASAEAGDEGRFGRPHEGIRAADLAVFLDVDGTLLEIAPSPEAVLVEPDLIALLRALVLQTDGAVAFVSGRSIETLDRLFQPLMLPAAGLHGFERRTASGTYCRRPLPPGELLLNARSALQALLTRHPGLLLEDKHFALAVHYRKVPELERVVLAEIAKLERHLAPAFEIQRGRCVVELRPADANKALAIEAFMQEAPFQGRRPLCLGDDLTDECAFRWVNGVGGLSVAVGVLRDTAATGHLPSVQAARLWLRKLVAQTSS